MTRHHSTPYLMICHVSRYQSAVLMSVNKKYLADVAIKFMKFDKLEPKRLVCDIIGLY